MANEKKAGAAGQGAALPEIPATSALDAVLAQSAALQHRSMHQLVPLCRSLALLTNMHRVLVDVRDSAASQPELAEPLRRACSTWMDPFAAGDTHDTINDFARVVAEQARELADQIEEMDITLSSIQTAGLPGRAGR